MPPTSTSGWTSMWSPANAEMRRKSRPMAASDRKTSMVVSSPMMMASAAGIVAHQETGPTLGI